MTLAEKVKAVEEIFHNLDEEIAAFQTWSGLGCQSGCGKCCFKPDISATALEFLPLAYELFRTGEIEAAYQKVTGPEATMCVFVDPARTSGMCTSYHHRGLICRLFGFSARINKLGQADLITCRIIKTEQQTPYQQALVFISKGEKTVPLAARYYTRLMSVDAHLGTTVYPINTALRKAMEEVMHYYAYRSPEDP